MRKIITTTFLLGLISLTGCSAVSKDKQINTTEQEQTTVQEQTTSQEQTTEQADTNSINVYSARDYDVDKEIFARFEEETGIKVNLIEGKGDELIERLNREKDNPQADLFLTVGAETISYALKQDLLQNHEIDNVGNIVEEGFYGDTWIALTKRARVLVYDKNKNPNYQFQSYFDLGQEAFNDKLLVRSSTASYNIALTANIIQNFGSEKGREFVTGVVNSLAREPQGNDRDQAKGVVAGDGEFAIMNTYYISKLLNSADQAEVEVGKQIAAAFPEETHVNISWGGIVKGSNNQENAQKLLEYLLAEEQQTLYMNSNGEYPTNVNIELNEFLSGLGEFNQMTVEYETLGDYTTEAIMLMDELGWK